MKPPYRLDVGCIFHHGPTSAPRSVALLYRNDVLFKRRRPLQGKPTARVRGGKRREILQFSNQSRRSLFFYLFNSNVSLPCLVTLTYPPDLCPASGEKAKAHLDRLTTWLKRRNIRGIWRLHFMLISRLPHFHLFMTGFIDADELRAQWSRIITNYKTDAEPVQVQIQRIRFGRMVGYATRRDEQDDAPDWFAKPGKRWGQFGLGKPKPLAIVSGTPQELSGLVRATKKAVASQKKRGRRLLRIDRGTNSFTLYGGAKPARTYLKWQAKNLAESSETADTKKAKATAKVPKKQGRNPNP